MQDYCDLLAGSLTAAGIGVWAYDSLKNEYLYHSPFMDALHERPFTDYLHEPGLWTNTVHPLDQDRERASIHEAVSGQMTELQYRIVTPAGRVKWIQEKRRVIRDADGTLQRVEGISEDITLRKKAEDQIAQIEKNFECLFQSYPHPMWMLDADTQCFLDANRAATDYYGHQPDAFRCLTPRDLWAGAEKQNPDAEPHPAAALGRHVWRHRDSSGKTRLLEIITHPFFNDGKTTRLVVARQLADPTEADRRARRLHAELRHFRQIANQAFMIVSFDPQGGCLQANRTFLKRLKYRRSELSGRTFRSLIPAFYPDRFFEDMTKTIRRGETWQGEVRMVAKDGTFCWTNTFIIPICDEQGLIQHFLAVQNDLTQGKEQEMEIVKLAGRLMTSESETRAALANALSLNQQLEFTKKRLTNAQQLAGLGSWDWDVAQKKLYCSAGLFHIAGVPDQPVLEKDGYLQLLRHVHPEDYPRVLQAHRQCLECLDLEYRLVRPDGEIRHIHELSTTETDETGQVCYCSGTVQDMTARKQHEMKLQNQNRILEEIAQVSSHTIRRPVSSLLGLVSLFDFENPTNPFNAEIVALVSRAANELDGILHHLVDKTQEGQG